MYWIQHTVECTSKCIYHQKVLRTMKNRWKHCQSGKNKEELDFTTFAEIKVITEIQDPDLETSQ